MMNHLRKKIWKMLFGLFVLTLLATKFLTSSVSMFLSSEDAFAIEKSAEESKAKEEESFDKLKKKFFLYECSMLVSLNASLVDATQALEYMYRANLRSFPAKNVPTPPPDLHA
ncbi:hypothetical protein [Pedobacter sp. MW01-1-1]|uniref:hypothetical protein n=1 Tax=Pedobacter sp. MW01-1-1 TaxID=3383027 RepID=UPI003FED6E50